VGAVKTEYQRPFVPLKKQPTVKRIPALDEIADDSQADARMQMRPAISSRRSAH